MTQPTDLLTDRPTRHRLPGAGSLLGWAALLAVLGWFTLTYGAPGFRVEGARLGDPDWALLFSRGLAVRIHLFTAVAALVVGSVLLAGVKGDRMHRTLGWSWVITMAVTAVSSLFIRQINDGMFSLIHLLSGWAIVALPMAVYAARRHRVASHRRAMTGLFVGGLLVAGAFAALPGRLLWAVFVG